MAKKSSRDSKMSSGNRKKINKAREEKRQAYFKKKREEGQAYCYTPNPYKKGTSDYEVERLKRAEKAKSPKCEYARLKSIFDKLDNSLNSKKKN